MKQGQQYGITQKEVQHFLKYNPPKTISSARIISEIYFWQEDYEGDIAKALSYFQEHDALPENTRYPEETMQWLKVIQRTTEPAALLELLRKQIPVIATYALRQAVLAREAEMLPLLQQRLLHNQHTIFIENVVYCLLRFQTNTADWIVANYGKIANEYLKSSLCLIVGYRGTLKHLLFLMQEFVRFSALEQVPQYEALFEQTGKDSLEQAPLLAIEDLYERWKDGEFQAE